MGWIGRIGPASAIVFGLVLGAAAACATGRGADGPAPGRDALVVETGDGAAYVAGEALVRLVDGAEAPARAGPYHCTVAVAGGPSVVLLRCTDDAGELAPVEPLCAALRAHPAVVHAEPNWIRGHHE